MESKPVTEKYTDISTTDAFQFVFHCAICGAGARSEKYVFNTEGFDGRMNENARAFLWLRQHDAAYERTNSEARFDFNVCPVCGRRVCGKCFHASPLSDDDICDDCKRKRRRPRPLRREHKAT